jgi:hypothetical protein
MGDDVDESDDGRPDSARSRNLETLYSMQEAEVEPPQWESPSRLDESFSSEMEREEQQARVLVDQLRAQHPMQHPVRTLMEDDSDDGDDGDAMMPGGNMADMFFGGQPGAAIGDSPLFPPTPVPGGAQGFFEGSSPVHADVLQQQQATMANRQRAMTPAGPVPRPSADAQRITLSSRGGARRASNADGGVFQRSPPEAAGWKPSQPSPHSISPEQSATQLRHPGGAMQAQQQALSPGLAATEGEDLDYPPGYYVDTEPLHQSPPMQQEDDEIRAMMAGGGQTHHHLTVRYAIHAAVYRLPGGGRVGRVGGRGKTDISQL